MISSVVRSLQYALVGALVNFLTCWLPPAPFIGFIGAGVGAKMFLAKYLKLSESDRILYSILVSALSGLLCSLSFLIIFIPLLTRPDIDDWLRLGKLHLILRQQNSQLMIFILVFVISFISSWIGAYAVFKTGQGQKKLSEEEYLNRLSFDELQEELEKLERTS